MIAFFSNTKDLEFSMNFRLPVRLEHDVAVSGTGVLRTAQHPSSVFFDEKDGRIFLLDVHTFFFHIFEAFRPLVVLVHHGRGRCLVQVSLADVARGLGKQVYAEFRQMTVHALGSVAHGVSGDLRFQIGTFFTQPTIKRLRWFVFVLRWFVFVLRWFVFVLRWCLLRRHIGFSQNFFRSLIYYIYSRYVHIHQMTVEQILQRFLNEDEEDNVVEDPQNLLVRLDRIVFGSTRSLCNKGQVDAPDDSENGFFQKCKEYANAQSLFKAFRVKRVGTDGACLFRTFSQWFSGSEANHPEFRQRAVRRVLSSDMYIDFVDQNWAHTMRLPGTWGDVLAIVGLSEDLYARVVVYRIHPDTGEIFRAFFTPSDRTGHDRATETLRTITILNEGWDPEKNELDGVHFNLLVRRNDFN